MPLATSEPILVLQESENSLAAVPMLCEGIEDGGIALRIYW